MAARPVGPTTAFLCPQESGNLAVRGEPYRNKRMVRVRVVPWSAGRAQTGPTSRMSGISNADWLVGRHGS